MSITVSKGNALEALGNSVLDNVKERMRDKKNGTLKKVKLSNSLVSKIKSKNLNNSSIIKISLKHNNKALALAFSAEKEKNRNLINEKMLLQKEIQTLVFDRSLVRQSVNQLKEALQGIWTFVNSKVSDILDSSSADDEYTVQPSTVRFSDLKNCRANKGGKGDMIDDPPSRKFGMPMRVPVSKGENVKAFQNSAGNVDVDRCLKEPPKDGIVLEPKEPEEQLQPPINSVSLDFLQHMDHTYNNGKCSPNSISSWQQMDETSKMPFYSMTLPDNVTTRRKRSTLTNSGRLLFPISFDEEKCEVQFPVLENTALGNFSNSVSCTKALDSTSTSIPESSSEKTCSVTLSPPDKLQTEETVFDAEMELTASEVGEIMTVATVCREQNAGRKMVKHNVSDGKQENGCEGGKLRKVKHPVSSKNRSKSGTDSDNTNTVGKDRKKRKHCYQDSAIDESENAVEFTRVPVASSDFTGSNFFHEPVQEDRNPDFSYSCAKLTPKDLAVRRGHLSSTDCTWQPNKESEHANCGSDETSAICSMENQCEVSPHSLLNSEANVGEMEDDCSQAECNILPAFLESPDESGSGFKIPRKIKAFNSRKTIVISCRKSITGSVNVQVPEFPFGPSTQTVNTEMQTEGDRGNLDNASSEDPLAMSCAYKRRKKEKIKNALCDNVIREKAKTNEPLKEASHIYSGSKTVKFNIYTEDACIGKPETNKDFDSELPPKPVSAGVSSENDDEHGFTRIDKGDEEKANLSESCTVEHPAPLITEDSSSEPAKSPQAKKNTEIGKLEDNSVGATSKSKCPKRGKVGKEKHKRETFVIPPIKPSKGCNAGPVGLVQDNSMEFSDFFAKPAARTETGVRVSLGNAIKQIGCTRKGKDESKRKTFILSSEKLSEGYSAECPTLDLFQERSDLVAIDFWASQTETGTLQPHNTRGMKEMGCTTRGKGAKEMSKRKTFVIPPVKPLQDCTVEQLTSKAACVRLAECSDLFPQPDVTSECDEHCTAKISSSNAVKEFVCTKKGKAVKQKSNCKAFTISTVKPSEGCNSEQKASEADWCDEPLDSAGPNMVTETGTLKMLRKAAKEFGCVKKGRDAKEKSKRETFIIPSVDHFKDSSVEQTLPMKVEESSVEWSDPSLKSELETFKVPRNREFGCVKGRKTQEISKRETTVRFTEDIKNKCTVEQTSDLTQEKFMETMELQAVGMKRSVPWLPVHQTDHEMIDMISDSILLNCSADAVLNLESSDVLKSADQHFSPQKPVICPPDGVLSSLYNCNLKVLPTDARVLTVTTSQDPSSRNEEQENVHQTCLQNKRNERCQKMKTSKNKNVLRDLTNKELSKASPESQAQKDQDNSRRQRRAAMAVNYKEPSGRRKIRRGDDASFINNDFLSSPVFKKKSTNKIKSECEEGISSVSTEVSGQYC
ncbi:uncharacterized protein LOC122793038 isoform X2 [Protopterus annectens]|uniref:uncharacterized protein LOC122793038 isoform X2 n=1 Tax=Protopterus annectens TaxID=7888 RepID=UPI001CFABD7E|nr:uncharacterized protein LOC122793038 isoform X2 [Protopterus annectens]